MVGSRFVSNPLFSLTLDTIIVGTKSGGHLRLLITTSPTFCLCVVQHYGEVSLPVALSTHSILLTTAKL